MKYTTKLYETEIEVEAYLKDYVDVEKFLGFCKQCGNYNHRWACPSFDFDPMGLWRNYQRLKVVGVQVLFGDEVRGKTLTEQEFRQLYQESLMKESDMLYSKLKTEEQEDKEKRLLLYPGSCHLCGDEICDREVQQCRHPEERRYSIEALGGDVGKTAEELLCCGLQWIEAGKTPDYLFQIGGILYKE